MKKKKEGEMKKVRGFEKKNLLYTEVFRPSVNKLHYLFINDYFHN